MREGNCEGYECVNTYDDNQTSSSTAANINRLAAIFAKAYYTESGPTKGRYGTSPEENIMNVTYKIEVKNSGEFKLHDVKLNVTMPQSDVSQSMRYVDGSAKYLGTEGTLSTPKTDDRDPLTMQFKLDSFETGQSKYISFVAIYLDADESMKPEKLRIEASAPIEGNTPVTYIDELAVKEAAD